MKRVAVIFYTILNVFCSYKVTAAENDFKRICSGSREGDRDSLVENVSTIHGDYTEEETDLIVAAPDPLILSRFYSSRDDLQIASLGGWRFNPHTFLFIKKEEAKQSYTSYKENSEYVHVFVGLPEGSILTYEGWRSSSGSKPSLFTINVEEKSLGLANTARGSIHAWTNLKNNKLYFHHQTDSFELILCNGGKRYYVKHPSLEMYILHHEILPSGNKIFYEFNSQGQLSFIQETNASEKKVLAWIKLDYAHDIHIEASDGQTVDYCFQQDPTGPSLLTEVIRSNRPDLHYEYQVIEGSALLQKKILPEGRFVEVDYYADSKVKSVTTPTGSGELATTEFSYEKGCTQVSDPTNRKTIYFFDEDCQLTSIEQYLDGLLYRVHRKSWGKGESASYLLATSIEDGDGSVFYYKAYIYDELNRGNLIKERERGNFTGVNSGPLEINKNGKPKGEVHVKKYSYFSDKDTEGFVQGDEKGSAIQFCYRKGTNLLVKKYIIEGDLFNDDDFSTIKKRYLYEYNEDAVLIREVIDDGSSYDIKTISRVQERIITSIVPKKDLPNIGAPEIINEKYYDVAQKKTILLKRTINQFDSQGNIATQNIHDAKGDHRYSLLKGYERGLLVFETDPMGNEIHYCYDANQNLVLRKTSNLATQVEYGYDLGNNLTRIAETDTEGKTFETLFTYDKGGHKLSEIDRLGHESLYKNDDLGRVISITYPQVDSSIRSVYTYTYDLFDNPISITDPTGNKTLKTYNVRGKPTAIHHPDGIKEFFKYDVEGSLHRYRGKDGLIQVFEYDYIGRLNHIEYYKRESQGSEEGFKRRYYNYNAFHMISELNPREEATSYTYDGAGRLATSTKGNQKVEFIYDALGRTWGIKKWKSSTNFTLEIKEYDLLDRVIEERVENRDGFVLSKTLFVYNKSGQLQQVKGFPHNQESILTQYEYDNFGRLSKTIKGTNQETKILYDDAYVNPQGQKVQRRIVIDPALNETEEIYDVAGHIVKTLKRTQTGDLLSEIEASYDVLGNKISDMAAVISKGQPLRHYKTEVVLEQESQSRSIIHGKDTLEQNEVSYKYNAYGDLIAKYTPGSKDPITYQYSPRGNLRFVSYKQGKKEVSHQISYDLNKNVTEVNLSSQILKYSYDGNDLLLTEVIEDRWGPYQVSRTYDGEGKIKTLKLPDESVIAYTYDGPFVRSCRRLSKEGKEMYITQVTARDQMGNCLEETLVGLGGKRKQFWDELGRRVEIVTDFFQDKVSKGGYDLLDNMTQTKTSILGDGEYSTKYGYNALSQLISEKGALDRSYSYDSLGNPLQKDGLPYKINDLNQLIEAEDAVYSFDLNGNLSHKTLSGKTWIYQWNPLNQLISVQDPEQNKVLFTYDLSGRRLSKCVERNGEKKQVFRYFYLGETELGCVSEKGVIVELKVPSDPHHPQSSTSCAIEIKKELYIPLYNLQGNIACLVDPIKRSIVETYRYSAFGEEEIINTKGEAVLASSVGNPWRYQGKRIDEETGLIHFGYRYYDPQLGRWISPDPAGDVDGPNLYLFVHNNPVSYVDYFGLAAQVNENQSKDFLGYFYGEYEPACHCEAHRTCKRGGDIQNVLTSLSPLFAVEGVRSSFQVQSSAYEMGSTDLRSGGIGFINGINNTRAESEGHCSRISRYAQGSKVDGIYNATHNPVLDVLDCIAGHFGVSSPPVRLLKEQWNQFIATHGPNENFLQICHSGGAIHVYNALASSPKSVRDRIDVVAVSPGAIVPDELCNRAFNYASKRDFVPHLDVVGKFRYGDKLIMLDPAPGAPRLDHGLGSPTFDPILLFHVNEHLQMSVTR